MDFLKVFFNQPLSLQIVLLIGMSALLIGLLLLNETKRHIRSIQKELKIMRESSLGLFHDALEKLHDLSGIEESVSSIVRDALNNIDDVREIETRVSSARNELISLEERLKSCNREVTKREAEIKVKNRQILKKSSDLKQLENEVKETTNKLGDLLEAIPNLQAFIGPPHQPQRIGIVVRAMKQIIEEDRNRGKAQYDVEFRNREPAKEEEETLRPGICRLCGKRRTMESDDICFECSRGTV